jgi:tRNA1Val (adenine37-N6)-methyltransferase
MSVFKFKHFSISQENTTLKVGTDAMILGALVEIERAKNVLDIGTGTGVLSLMLAQQDISLQIIGIELDKGAYEEALSNVQYSSFAKQIKIVQGDFLNYPFESKFDLIVTNPPFFESTFLPLTAQKAIAKHLPNELLVDWISKIKGLLEVQGTCWMIIPAERMGIVLQIARKDKLFVQQIKKIYAKKDRLVRVILCLSHEELQPKEMDFIIRNEDGTYTEQYRKATVDFHFKTPVR